ncbi:MAG: carbohydrate porin [Acidobacteriota bacterium]
MSPLRRTRGLAACMVALTAWPTWCVAESAPTQADYRRLLERVEQLEQAQRQADQALGTDRISEAEPELVTRLKAVEFQTLEMQKQARQIEALEGIAVGASMTAVVQRALGSHSTLPAQGPSRANYRGDVSLSLPGGQSGDLEGRFFTHFRFGQGTGLGLRPTYTSTLNSSAFETGAGPDDSFAVLAQAWYQLNIPLPLGGYKPHSRQHLEINVGKMDPFLFFDQNAAADDETTRFLNNVFVHNPLLDSGGDAGVDAYGFTPGIRVAYTDQYAKGQAWMASVGVFGSGPSANFSGSLGKPVVIAQLEANPRLITGLGGNYRVYAWQNGRATNAVHSAAAEQTHTGWGASIDQRLDDDWTVFARVGRQMAGQVRFDQTLTMGAQTDGSNWGRAADVVGLAWGVLRTSTRYQQATLTDPTLAGYTAGGSERHAELYYRYRFNDRVQISPHYQWIGRPGADANAPAVKAIGLRMKVGF